MLSPLNQGVKLHQAPVAPKCAFGAAVSVKLEALQHHWKAPMPIVKQLALALSIPPDPACEARQDAPMGQPKPCEFTAVALPRSVQLDPRRLGAILLRTNALGASPLTAKAHDIAQVRFVSRLNELPMIPPPLTRDGLAFIRSREVLKRALPQRFLSLEKQAYWRERIAGSKRVAVTQVELLGLFPDVPLIGDSPVRYRAEEGAIAYQLPSKRVALSTVVVARHKLTGELILGRFHAE
jgi:hypothetical protein